MDSRYINERYAEIAAELIDKEKALWEIKDSHVSIIYLSSCAEKTHKGKIVYGLTEKVQEKYKWGIPCDFTITIFEPNVARFSEDQIRILLFHELLHIGIEFKEGDEEAYYTKGHDLEDFKLIIDRYGTDWAYTDLDLEKKADEAEDVAEVLEDEEEAEE